MSDVVADGIRTDFREVLANIREGELLYECGEMLEELIEAIQETGRKGMFTLEISVKPGASGDASKVLVSGRPKIKKPLPETLPSMFYTTADNTLVRDNPKQPRLPFGKDEDER